MLVEGILHCLGHKVVGYRLAECGASRNTGITSRPVCRCTVGLSLCHRFWRCPLRYCQPGLGHGWHRPETKVLYKKKVCRRYCAARTCPSSTRLLTIAPNPGTRPLEGRAARACKSAATGAPRVVLHCLRWPSRAMTRGYWTVHSLVPRIAIFRLQRPDHYRWLALNAINETVDMSLHWTRVSARPR
jgi:hypothetical protein